MSFCTWFQNQGVLEISSLRLHPQTPAVQRTRPENGEWKGWPLVMSPAAHQQSLRTRVCLPVGLVEARGFLTCPQRVWFSFACGLQVHRCGWVAGTQHFASFEISTAIGCTHMGPIKANGRHVSNLEGPIGKTETAAAIDPVCNGCYVRWIVQFLFLTCLHDFLVAESSPRFFLVRYFSFSLWKKKPRKANLHRISKYQRQTIILQCPQKVGDQLLVYVGGESSVHESWLNSVNIF